MRAALLTAFLVLFTTPALAVVTPFGQRVNEHIERSLAGFRATEAGTGNISGQSTGLSTLCFLEQRATADWGAQALGYRGLNAQDQALVRRAIAYLINNDAGLAPGGTGYVYMTGGSLMALSLYKSTDGPDDVGAARTVSAALQAGVSNLIAQQNAFGGWNYNTPSEDNDLSTTQFAVAGLSAASLHVALPAAVLQNAAAAVDAHEVIGTPGCFEYRSSNTAGCASSMTASAIWVQRLGDRGADHAMVQAGMRWIQANWHYLDHINPSWNQSYFYYLWAVTKALEVTNPQGAGLVSGSQIGGVRDSNADGFPQETRSWYYDVAWALTQPGQQLANGAWDCTGSRCWDSASSQAFATLVLLRSLGGVCVDQDGDGAERRLGADQCVSDNCPLTPNLDQADQDRDGVGNACDTCAGVADPTNQDLDGDGYGDVCDNCPNTANADQQDLDGDQIGDACDPIICQPTGAELCNGRDDDCDGQTDEGVPGEGLACATGLVGACGEGVTRCQGGAIVCVGQVQPTAEVCNGRDDDCDGLTDEDAPNVSDPCLTGLPGVCAEGQLQCRGGQLLCDPLIPPAPELCNGEDDNCDGQIDEGRPDAGLPCETGQVGQCGVGVTDCRDGVFTCDVLNVPEDERCDGLDNDCDGLTDEELVLGTPCDTGVSGICAVGRTACVDGETQCVPEVPTTAELCDGLDNDCDGRIDDDLPGEGERCATGERGRCAAGERTCATGLMLCIQEAQPIEEACNGQDDNCDGWIDEGLRNACGQCGEAPAELCNGQDDNCDGQVDEGDLCPSPQTCREGRCVDPCESNECRLGEFCVDGYCLTACELTECPPNQRCENGACVDPCEAVQCGPQEACLSGACVGNDCYHLGCDSGQRCFGGVCEPDPCAETACADGQFCREGDCVPSCAYVSCALGETCVDGLCQPNSCADVACPPGQRCLTGQCVPDPCADMACPDGRRCVDGQCSDDPCASLHCPQGQHCVVVEALAQCVGDFTTEPDGGVPDEDGAVLPDGEVADGGAPVDGATRDDAAEDDGAHGSSDSGLTQAEEVATCACDLSGTSSAPAWLALLALAGLKLRRRR